MVPRIAASESADDVGVKVYHEPTVRLMSHQNFHWGEMKRFLAEEGLEWERPGGDPQDGGDLIAETAGRLCYMSFGAPRPGGNPAYLKRIKEEEHGSVLEHSVWNFLFTGVSRTLTHELVRHRAGAAYSQLSQRYVDETTVGFVCPPAVQRNDVAYRIWEDAMSYARDAYAKLTAALEAGMDQTRLTCEHCYLQTLDVRTRVCGRCGGVTQQINTATDCRKWARSAARSVLPGATETKIFVTLNGRALRHVLEQRGGRGAEVEIRRLAVRILQLIQDEAPGMFGDYVLRPFCNPDGNRDVEITTQYRKV